MTTIAQLLEQIESENQKIKPNKIIPLNVCLVLDVSGSTSQYFEPKKTILAKEVEVMTQYILANSTNNHMLYSFDTYAYFHGKVNVLVEEDFVDLPNFRAGSSTNTCGALNLICENFKSFKPDKVVIFTDGQTDNRNQQEFNPILTQFKTSNTKIELVAVSNMDKNLETITANEESRIPGMDLVNMLGNSINSLNIYNLFHKETPFVGIQNSSIDKNSIMFMGIKVEGFIVNFISKLLNLMEENKSDLLFGPNLNDLKKLLSEIGKLLSVMFVNFPSSPLHPFLERIVSQIRGCVETIDPDRIIKIIEYGFNCSKSDVPVIMTNFEEHLKESTTKQNEFSDALSLLKKFGTGLNAQRKISIPYGSNAICVIDNGLVKLTHSLGEFPNSLDQFGNAYFGIDSSEQAIRIGIRKLCELNGFPNARNSPSVIFYVLNQMILMYLTGIDLECEHMQILRKLAKAQVSMEVMVSKGKYDGRGCLAYWKEGKQIPMHFSNTSTHTSLYSDPMINPLELSEPVWWALQMSMLGLFEEQKKYYDKTLEKMGIESNVGAFLTWFSKTYSEYVDGCVQLTKTSPNEKSIYTLDDFEPDEEVFELKDHVYNQNTCKIRTWYSKTEIETYVMTDGCVWCKYKPLSTDLCVVVRENWLDKISSCIKESKPVGPKTNTVFTSFSNLSVNTNNVTNSPVQKFRINLIGITGSGKSTCSEKIKNLIIQKGGEVLVVSADKWSKQNYKGKDLQNKILNEIRQFDGFNSGTKLKVVVMDLCNENGIVKQSFGFNFNSYTDINFYPNLDKNKFEEYESWCLSNVLSRPLHDSKSNYWLNPVSAGVNTCIKVHNLKAKSISKLLGINFTCNFDENLSLSQIKNIIKTKSDQYTEYLKTRNLDEEIENLLITNIVL
jgi:hypothetical protein